MKDKCEWAGGALVGCNSAENEIWTKPYSLAELKESWYIYLVSL